MAIPALLLYVLMFICMRSIIFPAQLAAIRRSCPCRLVASANRQHIFIKVPMRHDLFECLDEYYGSVCPRHVHKKCLVFFFCKKYGHSKKSRKYYVVLLQLSFLAYFPLIYRKYKLLMETKGI